MFYLTIYGIVIILRFTVISCTESSLLPSSYLLCRISREIDTAQKSAQSFSNGYTGAEFQNWCFSSIEVNVQINAC